MHSLPALIHDFTKKVGSDDIEIYNEFSLQHELGIFLRAALPGYRIQFERNISYFAPTKQEFTKRELDIAVFTPDKKELKYAIELKFPRNGQHPEQMFSFCKDIAFAEELKQIGFQETALLIFVDNHLFYRGSTEGIYGHFRGGRPITGRIEKPTGRKNEFVTIQGNYLVTWSPVTPRIHHSLIHIANVA